ncbi:variable large family protein [Borrelia turicatae]|uniref:Variable large protein n=1 Tax=Borrelia turicatae (strain 91E135) TaxID=314724 RepID=A0ABF7R0M1_BORT9|nr:variable large family protein [Borrelia turicatae]ASJ27767.1 VlpA1 [Borrelia turicatae 91E135]UPA14336.1 variable large family protein [Borrelia turicatae 91E135]
MKNKLNERIKNFNITILISLFLLLSCGSGQLQAGKDGEAATGGSSLSAVLMEVVRSTENVFYSFMTLVSDVLGFTVTKDTTKNQVGEHFNKLGKKRGVASAELEEVAKKATLGVDKNDVSKNPIRVAVEAAKVTLSTLKEHLGSLKDIGDANPIGEAASNKEGTSASIDGLNKALKALKEIVRAAKETGVPEPKAGTAALNVTGTDNKEGAKILSISSAHKPAATDAGKAAAILSTVSGEEMLASIVVSEEGDEELKKAADENTTAISFAKGGNGDFLGKAVTPKAAAVAGGIALRSLVNAGKLASGAADKNSGGKEDVQAVGIDAVNKLLGAVEDIIKKTVKNVLEKVKKEVDESREPKAAVSKLSQQ